MASGANSQPLGRFIPKAPAVVASESLLKPAYVAATAGAGTSTTTTRRSRFSDTPIPAPVISPGLVDRKSVSSRDFSRVEDSDYHRNGRGRGNDDADDSRSGFSKFGSPSASSDNNPSREGSAEPAKKKRKSRWAESSDVRSFIPGMPTIIPAHLTKEQEKAYLLQLQIEDYSRKLRTGDLGIPANAEERSPSPEPIYNHEGKRLNTRDMRTRRKLEDERHKLIQQMFELNPEYKPPSDYKAPLAKYTDKVVIPQDDHPEINFVGLLIGPRGNTLKQLEKDVGGYCKIIIRGKGSVKEGKLGRGNRDPLPGEDEPLHAYITGQSPEAVRGAVDRNLVENPFENLVENPFANPLENLVENPFENLVENPFENLVENPFEDLVENPFEDLVENPFEDLVENPFPNPCLSALLE
ncbi:Splicing factor 1 [Hypsibius exemplaris]|uniref:Branchpoint-bridging protein n=1 Tax=Hypsibius exemplaris TaxID=2072580 RepID=A0A1W0XBM9_HYPEX|nr:Splicing factor 1 [Hypsibius exemplaris]